MFDSFIKKLSILKKFLFINLIIFLVIGVFTAVYLNTIKPNLINKKASNHIKIIDNTIDHIKRLKINFIEDDIRKFLFSTRFLFQNLDRVVIFDSNFNLFGDTDTLDLDPRAFSQRLDVIETDNLNETTKNYKNDKKILNKEKNYLNNILLNYSNSSNFGKPYTFTKETYDQFSLVTIKNVNKGKKNIGYLAITENANDIRAAIQERKNFIIRTAIVVTIVVLIFSYVLNRYFLKPIKNLVNYTNVIKDKSKDKVNIEFIKKRNDELGILSKSLDEMTNELNKRITNAENFSTDLVHEIRTHCTILKMALKTIAT